MATIQDLYTTLLQKSGLEIIEADEKTKQLRIIARLHKSFGEQWKLVMHRLLVAEARTPWKVDISKKYFLRNGQVFYGWRLVFQAENLASHYADIIKVVDAAPPPARVTVEEVPLVGAATNRNTRTNVGSVDKVFVGPLALQRKMMGG